jgi:hypothetical protein
MVEAFQTHVDSQQSIHLERVRISTRFLTHAGTDLPQAQR